MYKICIQDHTSIEDIKLWTPSAGNDVVFEIGNTSSFAIFGEGSALGKLRDFELGGFKVIVDLMQNPLINKERGNEAVGSDLLPPILSSIFGLELLHISNSVEVRRDDYGLNLRSIIGNHIWREVRQNKGAITSGKFIYLISRHEYDIPLALRQSASDIKKFPSFESFQKNISRFISKLRGGEGSTLTEGRLIEWVFHCAQNASDHASYTFDSEPIRGYRGIILQKIILGPYEEIKNRKDLPRIVKNFISQRIEDGEIGAEGVVNVATVTDLGVGIQNTLENVGELSSLEMLQHAFEDGVTSKSVNDHERAGYGLGEAVSAARHMNALLYIVSSDQIAYIDFSDKGERFIPGQELSLTSLGDTGKASGSAISLVWASDPKSEDQLAMNL